MIRFTKGVFQIFALSAQTPSTPAPKQPPDCVGLQPRHTIAGKCFYHPRASGSERRNGIQVQPPPAQSMVSNSQIKEKETFFDFRDAMTDAVMQQ